MKNVLTIAGSDSCAGAGIQADLKTFASHGVYGLCAITAVTAQNTAAVTAVEELSPAIIAAQIDALFHDIHVHAVKTGMLYNTQIIRTVVQKLEEYEPQYLVVDPVMVSTSGCNLLRPDAVDELSTRLFPLASLVTPNIPEMKVLTGITANSPQTALQACRKLQDEIGCQNILLKGGHSLDSPVDWLYDGKEFYSFQGKRIDTNHTHGTGCTLSAAIAANLALGKDMYNAVKNAKAYVTQAIRNGIPLGHGHGPTRHFYELYRKAGVNIEEYQ